jgi:hypothetical protein
MCVCAALEFMTTADTSAKCRANSKFHNTRITIFPYKVQIRRPNFESHIILKICNILKQFRIDLRRAYRKLREECKFRKVVRKQNGLSYTLNAMTMFFVLVILL